MVIVDFVVVTVLVGRVAVVVGLSVIYVVYVVV